ncbi:arylsulfatase [Flammeovirga aprica]|uniref:Arylsulfatase n=1 Tax=Flammeovirga aprica JL-4 TaxID=694437 RepID=A0A7X9RY55_9BACT|nr:arylsulfatase [Flammeovirga aprica]NME70764.1 arylsulfatase [Flammeovirga aprica JL-4]
MKLKTVQYWISGLLLSLPLFYLIGCEDGNEKPNVILIVTDDQGYGDIQAHGNKDINTPQMDLLHSESLRLTNFHVSPTCAPTRSALMTGRDCNRVGVWHTVMGRSMLYEDEVTMADIFSENNYATAMFGKWHLGDNYPFAPHYRGFQEAFFHGGGGVGQTPDYWNNDYFDDVYLRNGKEEKANGYCTDVWFKEALSFIEKNKDSKKPFFCYIATNAPHGPLNVPAEYAKPYLDKGIPKSRAKFYGMIENIDINLGQLRAKLKEWKIEDNTILIFMSDNGTAYGAGFKGKELKGGYNANMRGTKGSAYDGGHRVPFYIHWKNGGLNVGKDMDFLSAHLDVLPTLMELCNLKSSKKIEFDGMDITQVIKGEEEAMKKSKERVLIGDSQRIVYPEKWRNSYVMNGQWRLINGEELYDLSKDPSQLNDIAKENAGKVAALRKAYEANWASISPTFQNFPYIKLGTKEEPHSMLTAHDWHISEEQPIAWNQKLIRKGVGIDGEWRVDFTKAGKYKIALSRWPKEADLAIDASAPKFVSDAPDYILPEGKKFTFKSAKLRIGDKTWEQTVPPNSKSVVFEVEVPKGETTMQATFTTSDNTPKGAYYVYVDNIG